MSDLLAISRVIELMSLTLIFAVDKRQVFGTIFSETRTTREGEDRIEKINEKFIQINQKINEEKSKLSFEPKASISSKIKIGNEKYDVKFNVCAGEKKIGKAKVLIKSQIESIEYGTTKDIPENACRRYNAQINAKNPDNIFITILEQVLG